MPDSPPVSARPHIMVFDAALAIRALMEELLTEDGDQVSVSPFLPESFAQIAVQPPALLIIDLALGAQVGWELLERLARDALTRRVPVLVTSTDQRLLERAEQAHVRFGGESWIVKPFDIAVMLGEVHRLIPGTP